MPANIISFATCAAGHAHHHRHPTARRANQDDSDNVVAFSTWFGHARPHRTPNGVYFTTGVFVTQGVPA